jgi:hypothetical protein
MKNLTLLLAFTALAATQFAFTALAATQSWQNTGSNTWQSVCPANNFNLGVTVNGITQTAYNFSANCYGDIANAGGGTADTTRNRLLLWTGGHGGSSGNEIYALNMTPSPSVVRLNNPSVFNTSFPGAGFSGTDLVIDSGNSAIVSTATYTFQSYDVGEYLIIWSGNGFTAHTYIINSVTGGKATLNQSAGTVGSTGGTWSMVQEFFPSDGTPTNRDTGGTITYIPQSVTACGVTGDKFFVWSGTLANGAGARSTWLLDATTLSWCDMYPEKTAGSYDTTQLYPPAGNGACAWNPNDNRVWCEYAGDNMLLAYSPSQNKWTQIMAANTVCVGTCFDQSYLTAAIDPVNKVFWMVGNGSQTQNQFYMWAINIDSASGSYKTITDHSSTQTGCSSGAWATNGSNQQTVPGSTLMGLNVPNPGFSYNPNTGHFLGYPWDGTTIYDYNPTTDTCTPTTYGGTVSYSSATTSHGGTYGRFAYFPSLNTVALYNHVANPGYTLNLTPTPTTILSGILQLIGNLIIR